MTEKNNEEIINLMEHPVFVMHDNSVKLIRAQLLFFSISTLLLISSNITIAQEGSSILGIKIDGLTLSDVLLVLVCFLIYQLIHFLWASWESFCEWRIRQTALDTGGFGGGGEKIVAENEYIKVRQTTLYSFVTRILKNDLKTLHEKINDIPEKKSDLKEIENKVNEIIKNLDNSRIGEAIWRFDNWYRMFCKMQNWRWLLLETLLPLVIGAVAIFKGIKSLIN